MPRRHPVIVITGYATMESAIEALNRGAFSYIIKPFNMAEVKAVIKRAGRQVRLLKENQKLIDELQLINRRLEKSLSELDRANRTKSQFLSRVGHELRTPINAIIGFTDFLMEDKKTGKQTRSDVRHISTNAQSLLKLINDILDLSKIEAGKIKIAASTFTIKPLINICTNAIISVLKDRPVSLEVNVDKALPKIKTDRDRLREVIVNLLSNAAKFTEKGKICIHAFFDKDGRVNISVSDTGIGIKEDDLQNVFEEFMQIDCGKKKCPGTGLGLAISRRLAHLLGGDILCESTFGKGSIFTVVIPAELRV